MSGVGIQKNAFEDSFRVTGRPCGIVAGCWLTAEALQLLWFLLFLSCCVAAVSWVFLRLSCITVFLFLLFFVVLVVVVFEFSVWDLCGVRHPLIYGACVFPSVCEFVCFLRQLRLIN